MTIVKEATNINMVYYPPFPGIREQEQIKNAEVAS